jgi:hypothetical protein
MVTVSSQARHSGRAEGPGAGVCSALGDRRGAERARHGEQSQLSEGAREVAEVRAGEGSAEWKGDVMGRGQKKKGDQKAAKKGSSGGGGP